MSICITPSNISYQASLRKELLIRAGSNKTSNRTVIYQVSSCNLKAVQQVIPFIRYCHSLLHCCGVLVLCQGQISDCVITWCLPLLCPKLFEKFCCTLVSSSCSEGIKIWYELPENLEKNFERKWLSLQLKWFSSFYSYYACIIALSGFFVVRLRNGPVVHLWKCPAEIWPASYRRVKTMCYSWANTISTWLWTTPRL